MPSRGVLVEAQPMEPTETLCAFNPAGDQTSAGPDHVSRRAIKPKLEDGTSKAVGWAADENLLQAGGDDEPLFYPLGWQRACTG